MSSRPLHSCDFCKNSSFNCDSVFFERVVVVDGTCSPKWEDICESCYRKLEKFVKSLRKEKE